MLATMREHGLVSTAAGLGLHGHACWIYADEAELFRAAGDYLADGARLGQRLLFVGPEELFDRAPGVECLPLSAFVEPGQPTDPDRMLRIYAAATDEALAAGYAGLRVVAEVTDLAADPGCQCRWESVADRFMVDRPLSAMCCYDRRRLAPEIVADLCAVHPVVNENVPFRIYAGAGGLLLDGEIDYFSADALRRVLLLTRGDGMLDLSGAKFIDHHGARVLHDSGMPLAGTPESMRRASELMGLA